MAHNETLEELALAVERGEVMTITQHGKPVAVMIRPDLLERLRDEVQFASG